MLKRYFSMSINEKQYNFLRTEYSEFVFESYSYEKTPAGLNIQFHFHVDNKFHFYPKTKIDFQEMKFSKEVKQGELDNLAFNIGLIELISYWKCICPARILIKPHKLDENQIVFWKKLWFHGLGEFFYINSIDTDIENFVTITSFGEKLSSFHFTTELEKTLVPVGGGKDSPVTMELVSSSGQKIIPLIINPRGATINTVKQFGLSDRNFVLINREIDAKLLELNSLGFLNGHTPFSAMLAFYTLLVSRFLSVSDIALSNESSANESTVLGTAINHQYSKSYEFESDFRNYYKSYISEDFNYFSFLRPLSELQIAALFSQMVKYHSVFRSCNVGSKEDIWCGHCSKCLFAYIILSPFLSPAYLSEIFGGNFYDDEKMEIYFKELTGETKVKPFECVGTVDEVNMAVSLAIEKFYGKNDNLPYLLRNYKKNKISKNVLKSWNNEHFLLSKYEKTLKDVCGIK